MVHALRSSDPRNLEALRALRQRLRTRLGWTGLGSINPTTWVTPRIDREPEAASKTPAQLSSAPGSAC